ncbi:MAG: VOC family protein [Angustibacter sp.]
MSTHDTPWPVGTPCWVDLSVDDQAAAQTFYAGLFGWQYDISGPEFGHYAMAHSNGRNIAGIGSKMGPDQPSVWTTYLASADLDETSTRIAAAGGVTHVAPMDIANQGRMMIAMDSSGAAFGAWQSRDMTGFALVNEPNAVIWNEHLSADPTVAEAFYGQVFGLDSGPLEESGAGVALRVGTEIVASAQTFPQDYPTGVPPHWLVYFAVQDLEATLARVPELGGTLLRPAVDSPWGSTAVISGPENEPIALIETPAEGFPSSDPQGATS